MANNELSGPSVATFIAKTLLGMNCLRYTYRFVFAPETIGSLCYLSKNLNHLRANVKYAYNLTCMGDDGKFSFMPTRLGNTDNDRIVRHILSEFTAGEFITYTILERGSDERQYCAPGADLPMCSIMRTKYHEYDFYHTSLDNLDFVTETGLFSSFLFFLKLISTLELNYIPRCRWIGEPMLSKRALYPSLGGVKPDTNVKSLLDVLYYCDGHHDCIDISSKTEQPSSLVFQALSLLKSLDLITS
jgi:aminopeptidase-like protein